MESTVSRTDMAGVGPQEYGNVALRRSARAGPKGLDVSEIHTTDAFEAIAPEWRALLSGSDVDCLFLTWEWLYTWWKHLAGSRRLRILTVRRGGTLVGIAPFALRAAQPGRLLPFRAIEFLGIGAVGSDYLDLILKRGEEECACATLADYLCRCRYMLDLRRVAVGSAHVERLAKYLLARGWERVRSDDDICLYVPLAGSSWEAYFAGLSRSFRWSLRRRRRAAEATHAVACVTVGNEAERLPALRAFVRMHQSRWDSRDGSQALPDSAVIRFHENWSGIALEQGWLRLSTLLFDGIPVAGIYGFAYGGRLYYYLPAFDPAYARCSPGRICLEEGLRAAFSEGLNEYDFLHGDEDYKYHWAHDFRALGRYQLFPPGFSGQMSRGLLRTRERCKRLLRPGQRDGQAVGVGTGVASALRGRQRW